LILNNEDDVLREAFKSVLGFRSQRYQPVVDKILANLEDKQLLPSKDPDELAISGTICTRVELNRDDPQSYVLGIGGTGKVLCFYDPKLSRQVAVKVMIEDHFGSSIAKQYIEAEQRLLARLNHPAIPAIYSTGEFQDGRLFYGMQRIIGDPLSDHLPLRGTEKPIEFLIERLIEICSAVDYAHDRSIFHCDIKSSNVIIEGNKSYLLDWGSATNENRGAGTPYWMAPEQYECPENCDGLTDIFLLGSLLYEMLTGYPPHFRIGDLERDHEIQVSEIANRFSDIRSPAMFRNSVSLELQSICLAAMANDRAERKGNYKDVRAFISDLKAWQTNDFVAVHSYSPLTTFGKKISRYPVISSLTVIGSLLLISLIASWIVLVGRAELLQAEKEFAEEKSQFMTQLSRTEHASALEAWMQSIVMTIQSLEGHGKTGATRILLVENALRRLSGLIDEGAKIEDTELVLAKARLFRARYLKDELRRFTEAGLEIEKALSVAEPLVSVGDEAGIDLAKFAILELVECRLDEFGDENAAHLLIEKQDLISQLQEDSTSNEKVLDYLFRESLLYLRSFVGKLGPEQVQASIKANELATEALRKGELAIDSDVILHSKMVAGDSWQQTALQKSIDELLYSRSLLFDVLALEEEADGNFESAIEVTRGSLACFGEKAGGSRSRKFRSARAIGLVDLGRRQRKHEALEEAVSTLENAIGEFLVLHQEYSEDTQIEMNLVGARHSLALTLRSIGEYDRAVETLLCNLRPFIGVDATDIEVADQIEEAETNFSLATTLCQADRNREAAEYFLKSLDYRRAVLIRNPDRGSNLLMIGKLGFQVRKSKPEKDVLLKIYEVYNSCLKQTFSRDSLEKFDPNQIGYLVAGATEVGEMVKATVEKEDLESFITSIQGLVEKIDLPDGPRKSLLAKIKKLKN